MPELNAQYFKMYWHWISESWLNYKALGYCPNGNPRFVDLYVNPPAGIDPSVAKERQTKQSEILADNLRKSALFRRAWIVRSTEGEVASVELPGIEVRHFKLYQHWIRTSELDYTALGYNRERIPKFTNPLLSEPSRILTPSEEKRIEKQSNNLADNLVHLWALGRLLGDDELQRITMDELREWYVRKAVQGVTSFVSEQTLAFVDRVTQAEPEGPLRHFCVRWARSMFAIIEVDIQHFSETAPNCLSDKVLFSRPFEPR
jgi:hypothetical protein